jgi:hypothetical protein
MQAIDSAVVGKKDIKGKRGQGKEMRIFFSAPRTADVHERIVLR